LVIPSCGRWRAVKEAYRQGIRLVSDERLLGSSEFVERTLKAAQEANEWRRRLQSDGIGLSATSLEAAQNSIKSTKKQRPYIPLEKAGHIFEWSHIKQDLQALQKTHIEENGHQFAIRSRAEGVCRKVFQAVGMAMPPTIREI
jgi:hypothetical protein